MSSHHRGERMGTRIRRMSGTWGWSPMQRRRRGQEDNRDTRSDHTKGIPCTRTGWCRCNCHVVKMRLEKDRSRCCSPTCCSKGLRKSTPHWYMQCMSYCLHRSTFHLCTWCMSCSPQLSTSLSNTACSYPRSPQSSFLERSRYTRCWPSIVHSHTPCKSCFHTMKMSRMRNLYSFLLMLPNMCFLDICRIYCS